MVGIGGRYCAGKGLLTSLFADNGYRVIDVDAVGHQVLRERSAAIAHHFGSTILNAQRTIDRTRLRKIVFRSQQRLNQLERIVHPPMKRWIEQQVRAQHSAKIVIDAALLYYLGLDTLCDTVIWVTAPLLIRLWRAWKRDRLSPCAALQLIRRQKKLKLEKRNADTHIVHNYMSKQRLMRNCKRVFAKWWEAEQ